MGQLAVVVEDEGKRKMKAFLPSIYSEDSQVEEEEVEAEEDLEEEADEYFE